MTTDFQSNKTRDAVLIVGLVFLLLSCLMVEVVSYKSSSSCFNCGSHQSRRTIQWAAYGAHGSTLTGNPIQPSRFLRDFPEFQCNHDWNDGAEVEKKLWNSPLICLSLPRTVKFRGCGGLCCSKESGPPVWEQYETDEDYRDSIHELLENGTATREQLVALVTDSEYLGPNFGTAADEAILKLLYPDRYSFRVKSIMFEDRLFDFEVLFPKNTPPPI
jgi:hypothetical protein